MSTGSRAVAQGAARSAVVKVTVSSSRDVPSLVRGDMSAVAAGPVTVGGVVVIATGVVVGKGFAVIRRGVRGKQQQRRGTVDDAAAALTATSGPPRPAADTGAQTVSVTLELAGDNIFTEARAADIRRWLVARAGPDAAARKRAGHRLRSVRFSSVIGPAPTDRSARRSSTSSSPLATSSCPTTALLTATGKYGYFGDVALMTLR